MWRAKSTARMNAWSVLSSASTRMMFAFGARAWTHSTSIAVSLAQLELPSVGRGAGAG